MSMANIEIMRQVFSRMRSVPNYMLDCIPNKSSWVNTVRFVDIKPDLGNDKFSMKFYLPNNNNLCVFDEEKGLVDQANLRLPAYIQRFLISSLRVQRYLIALAALRPNRLLDRIFIGHSLFHVRMHKKENLFLKLMNTDCHMAAIKTALGEGRLISPVDPVHRAGLEHKSVNIVCGAMNNVVRDDYGIDRLKEAIRRRAIRYPSILSCFDAVGGNYELVHSMLFIGYTESGKPLVFHKTGLGVNGYDLIRNQEFHSMYLFSTVNCGLEMYKNELQSGPLIIVCDPERFAESVRSIVF